MAPVSPPAGIQEATKKSTQIWQNDLLRLFHLAKDRFPDVVWEVQTDGGEPSGHIEEVWGHKGVYAG